MTDNELNDEISTLETTNSIVTLQDNKKAKRFVGNVQLDGMKARYYNGIMIDYMKRGKKINERLKVKANNRAYKTVKTIYDNYYKKMRKDSKEDTPINGAIWTKAETQYEEHQAKVRKVLATIGLSSFMAFTATGCGNKQLPEATGWEPIPIETGVDQANQNTTKDESTEKTNASDEFKKQYQVTDEQTQEVISEQEKEKAQAQKQKEENEIIYQAIIDAYNNKYSDTLGTTIAKKDTEIVRDSRVAVLCDSEKNILVHDLWDFKGDRGINGTEYDEKWGLTEKVTVEDFTYILDTKNQRIVMAIGELDGDTRSISMNYFKGASGTEYTCPDGGYYWTQNGPSEPGDHFIENALTLDEVIMECPKEKFEAEKDDGTIYQRIGEAVEWEKEQKDKAKDSYTRN